MSVVHWEDIGVTHIHDKDTHLQDFQSVTAQHKWWKKKHALRQSCSVHHSVHHCVSLCLEQNNGNTRWTEWEFKKLTRTLRVRPERLLDWDLVIRSFRIVARMQHEDMWVKITCHSVSTRYAIPGSLEHWLVIRKERQFKNDRCRQDPTSELQRARQENDSVLVDFPTFSRNLNSLWLQLSADDPRRSRQWSPSWCQCLSIFSFLDILRDSLRPYVVNDTQYATSHWYRSIHSWISSFTSRMTIWHYDSREPHSYTVTKNDSEGVASGLFFVLLISAINTIRKWLDTSRERRVRLSCLCNRIKRCTVWRSHWRSSAKGICTEETSTTKELLSSSCEALRA